VTQWPCGRYPDSGSPRAGQSDPATVQAVRGHGLRRGVREDLNARSLAAVRPARVDRLDFERHGGWSEEELARFDAYRAQGELFRDHVPDLLEPPRFSVHLNYRCTDPGCRGHRQRIIDWELTALQHRFRRRPDDDLVTAVTSNFLETPFGSDRAPLIFVGNQEDPRRRGSFVVLGLYYPRRGDRLPAETLF
jgi:hypothetical protein